MPKPSVCDLCSKLSSAVPAYLELAEAADCPVCGTEAALTPQRILELRERVAAASGIRQAQRDATTELTTFRAQLQAAEIALDTVVPLAATMDEQTVEAASRRAAEALGMVLTSAARVRRPSSCRTRAALRENGLSRRSLPLTRPCERSASWLRSTSGRSRSQARRLRVRLLWLPLPAPH